jgi:hypothetical protein
MSHCIANKGVMESLFVVICPDDCRISVTVIDSTVAPCRRKGPSQVVREQAIRHDPASPLIPSLLLK